MNSVTTPEKKVKDKVKRVLDDLGAYHFMPATHGYGSSGVPDVVACLDGRFVGIECKANGGKLSALQERALTAITQKGGIAIAVDESGVGVLKMILTTPQFTKIDMPFFNLLKYEI